jgi:predicted adenine nucleotide alpha hydrolase (AANH) superfamily ATPase
MLTKVGFSVQRNYSKELSKLLQEIDQKEPVPTLLLHSCCAPCSSYVLEYLADHFQITIFYYNPNIYPLEEFTKRLNEQQRLLSLIHPKYPVNLIDGEYENERYEQAIAGLESEKEGGERCYRCYALRLEKTAEMAQALNYDYFGTTLSVSPYKNAPKINEIGEIVSATTGEHFLIADFKKNEGYKRSIELSKKYGLYRQDYCGCRYSLLDRNQHHND